MSLSLVRFQARIPLPKGLSLIVTLLTTYCFTGQTGLGKSTLINTIFASHLMDSKGRFAADEPVRQTTEIQTVSHGTFCMEHLVLYQRSFRIRTYQRRALLTLQGRTVYASRYANMLLLPLTSSSQFGPSLKTPLSAYSYC